MPKNPHIKPAIAYLKRYIDTYDRQLLYDQQLLYEEYSDRVFIDDILYGLGASLDKKYENADGYRVFLEEVLIPHIKWITKKETL